MPTVTTMSPRKGRLSLSIAQDLLDRLEPYRDQINFSAEAEQLLVRLLERQENLAWVKRNSDALVEHGKCITSAGLAGQEFERI